MRILPASICCDEQGGQTGHYIMDAKDLEEASAVQQWRAGQPAPQH